MNQTFTNLLLWLAAIDSTFLVNKRFYRKNKVLFAIQSDFCDFLLLSALPLPLLQGPGVPPDPPLPAPPHQCVHVCQCVLCDSPGCGEVSTYCQASSKQ